MLTFLRLPEQLFRFRMQILAKKVRMSHIILFDRSPRADLTLSTASVDRIMLTPTHAFQRWGCFGLSHYGFGERTVPFVHPTWGRLVLSSLQAASSCPLIGGGLGIQFLPLQSCFVITQSQGAKARMSLHSLSMSSLPLLFLECF